jgi:TRAP-type C4-dicarboxylate transport system permease small subunit
LVNRCVTILSMLGILAAALILTSSVVLRYFLKIPTDWQDEAAVFLLVGVTFLCGAQVQAVRGHVGIQALSGLLPAGLERLRGIVTDIAAGGFCTFFTWKSWTLFGEAWVDGQTTDSAWAPPLSIPYGLMAGGMTLLTLQIALQIATACAGREDPR